MQPKKSSIQRLSFLSLIRQPLDRQSTGQIKSGRLAVVVLALVLVCQPAVFAQTTFNWTGGNNDNIWSFGDNWDGNSDPNGPVPGSTDTAIFNLNSTYAVRFDAFGGEWDLGSLDIESGNITFEVFGSGSRSLKTNTGVFIAGSSTVLTLGPNMTWNDRTDFFIDDGASVNISNANSFLNHEHLLLGSGDSASFFNVSNGGVVNGTQGTIGTAEAGNVTVTGTGSRWTNTSNLAVSNGTLNIANGGEVRVGDDTTAIFGSDSKLVVSGSGSNGELTIDGFGTIVDVDRHVEIGLGSGMTGTVTVSRGGELNVGTSFNDNLSVGRNGTGTLTISQGGKVTTNSLFIGTVASGTGNVTVTGSGSLLESTGTYLHVGRSGNGTLTISDGGVVNGGFGDIGFFSSSSGSVTVTGAGSQWNSRGSLFVGNSSSSSTGTLNISDSGLVSTDAQAFINATSSVNLSNGATFIATGGVTNDGSINVTSGLVDVHGVVTNSDAGMIDVGGALVTFHDNVLMDAANMNIQNEGLVTFLGSYNGGSDGLGAVQAFGEFTPGNSPATVTFGGNLEFASSTDTFFEIGGLATGEFDSVMVGADLTLDGTLSLDLINGFELTAGDEFLIFDVQDNLFGTFVGLNEGDLVQVFGQTGLRISYAAGDGNDVSLFASAIPEPGSCALLGLISLALAVRRPIRKPISQTC